LGYEFENRDGLKMESKSKYENENEITLST